MTEKTITLFLSIFFLAGIFACADSPDTANFHGDWEAVSADITDPRDGHQIMEASQQEMVRTDKSMVLSFSEDKATIQMSVQTENQQSESDEFTGTWQFQDDTGDSLIVQTGDVEWRFQVTELTTDRMVLAFNMPMMPENQVHQVEFVRQ
ncbi:MAG: hypothetical protein GF372_05895 [Candidatus Marinimicrobia bacterium]|nr:hypothetical protein [Candidatus Neomarinimicrobiota bacterium]